MMMINTMYLYRKKSTHTCARHTVWILCVYYDTNLLLTDANGRAPYSTACNIGARIRGQHIEVKVVHPLPFPG